MQEKEKSNLTYAKRNWYKANLRLLSLSESEWKGYDIIMYIANRKVYFNCYNISAIETMKKVNLQEKVKVWFSAESKEYKGKWYTSLILKHVEVPRLINLEKLKDEVRSNSFNFNNEENDF